MGGYEANDRPRALVVAFECDPGAGSEAGAGWGMVCAIASVADVTVLVDARFVPCLEQWLTDHPEETRMRFIGIPTIDGNAIRTLIRVHRQFDFVKYLVWMRRARKSGIGLHKERGFDVAVHAAYGSYWLPSPVVDFGPPSVWGPVGGATVTPRRMMPLLGWKGFLGEFEGRVMIRLGSLFPSTRRTWRKATLLLSETPQTRDALPMAVRNDVRIINRAILSRVPDIDVVERSSYLVFPSSLQGRKGPRLAVLALAHTPSTVRLRFISDGYEEAQLRRQAKRLGVDDRVEFLGRVPRDEMFEMMAETAGVVFAGLREEGGCALSEAMLLGAPVIVLGHAGPRVIAEQNTDQSRVALIDATNPKRTAREMGEAMTRFSENPSTNSGNYLDRAGVEIALGEAVLDAVNLGRAGS